MNAPNVSVDDISLRHSEFLQSMKRGRVYQNQENIFASQIFLTAAAAAVKA